MITNQVLTRQGIGNISVSQRKLDYQGTGNKIDLAGITDGKIKPHWCVSVTLSLQVLISFGPYVTHFK